MSSVGFEILKKTRRKLRELKRLCEGYVLSSTMFTALWLQLLWDMFFIKQSVYVSVHSLMTTEALLLSFITFVLSVRKSKIHKLNICVLTHSLVKSNFFEDCIITLYIKVRISCKMIPRSPNLILWLNCEDPKGFPSLRLAFIQSQSLEWWMCLTLITLSSNQFNVWLWLKMKGCWLVDFSLKL